MARCVKGGGKTSKLNLRNKELTSGDSGLFMSLTCNISNF